MDLAGVPMPDDRVMDGVSMVPLLRGEKMGQRDEMFFYRGARLYAVRKGPWKMHLITQKGYGDQPHPHEPPLLFHLEHDPSEQYDVAKEHPNVVAELQKLIEAHQATIKPVPSQLERRIEKES
jgi:hypothetical protein